MMQPKTPKKGIKVTKTESTVIKPVPAKQKYTSLGGEIGRPTGPSTGRRKTTMGSAKNGKSFPDLNKEGRGVIAKKGASVKKKAGMHKMPNGSMMKNSMMKMGGTVKKAMMGTTASPMMKSGGKMSKCKYGCN